MKLFVVCLSLISIAGSADVLKNQKILHHLVFEIRDPKTGPKDFRAALERIGEYLASEVMQDLGSHEVSVETLTGSSATHSICNEKPVLVTILRAGLPLLHGMQKVFSDSEAGFIGMARDEETLEAKIDYIALPEMKGRTVVITDTMLATGGSLIDAVKIIEKYSPSKIIVVCAIASQAGIEKLLKYDSEIEIYPAAIDPTLSDKGYIVPGLGDAGDRSFGRKR